MIGVCPRCKKEDELSDTLYKQGRGPGTPCCFQCSEYLIKRREDMRAWKAKNAEKNRAWSKNYAKNNREKVNAYTNEMAKTQQRKDWHNEYRRNRKEIRAEEARRYREKYGDTVRSYRRKWYAENKETWKEYRRNYIKQNPGFNRAASARHRALILQRTVSWADLGAIKKFYQACPEGLVVDHIIPLRGENVSGLHVLSNLQYLTFEENSRKSNKFDIEDIKS